MCVCRGIPFMKRNILHALPEASILLSQGRSGFYQVSFIPPLVHVLTACRLPGKWTFKSIAMGRPREKEQKIGRSYGNNTAMRDRPNKWGSTYQDDPDHLVAFPRACSPIYISRTVPAATEPELSDGIICLCSTILPR